MGHQTDEKQHNIILSYEVPELHIADPMSQNEIVVMIHPKDHKEVTRDDVANRMMCEFVSLCIFWHGVI